MNDFTKAEADLVVRIVNEVEIMAYSETIYYAKPEDREAAAKAVIELVKERLNAY